MLFRIGRPAVLMQQVGEAGAAGAGSPPGTPPAGANGTPATGDGGGQGGATPPPAGNGSAAAPPPKTFTQEEVNRIAATARDEGRRSATKPPETPDPKAGGQQQPAGQQPPDVTSIVNQAVEIALRAAGVDSFTVAARQAGYSDAQVQIARAAHDAAKPPDTGKWLAEWPTQVGMTITKAQNGGTGAPTPAASNGGAPRKVEDLRDEAGLIDVFSLSPEQTVAMGPQKIREEFEKVLDRHRQLSGAPPVPSVLRKK